MTALPMRTAFAIGVTIAVAALATLNWYFEPDKIVLWSLPLLVLLVGWFILTLGRRGRVQGEGMDERKASHFDKAIVGAIVLAGLLLAVSLASGLLEDFNIITATMSDRGNGVMIGIMLIVTGNAIPKNIKTGSAEKCEFTRGQKMQRFAGWAFVIAGIAYAGVWLFAPLPFTEILPSAFVAIALVLILVRGLWSILV